MNVDHKAYLKPHLLLMIDKKSLCLLILNLIQSYPLFIILQSTMIKKSNPTNFRHLLFSSILAEQNILIQDINKHKNPPGLKPEQSRFLNLVQTISNGSKIIVTKGSTNLKFYPGLITNNQGVELHFQCGQERSISYYLQYLLLLAMFGKNTLNIHMTGITNDNHDNSVDAIQQHLIPLLKDFYEFDNEFSMQIVKRGYEAEGGGHIHITIPTIKKLKSVCFLQKGYIKRIRGVCSGSKISTSILNQIKDKIKAELLQYLPDVWIYTDFYKGQKSSKNGGYSLCLKAETTNGCIITYDSAFESGTTQQYVSKSLNMFLDEIRQSGVISTNYQWFLLTLMALSEKKTSAAKLGRLSAYTIQCLRITRDIFGITFQIQQSKTDSMAIFRCLGLGYQNYGRIVK